MSLAARSQSGQNRRERGSKNVKRAPFGPRGSANWSENSARPSSFAYSVSSRALRTVAATPVIESMIRAMLGRTFCGAAVRRGGRSAFAVRARCARWSRSASLSCSASATDSRTLSETPRALPRSSRV